MLEIGKLYNIFNASKVQRVVKVTDTHIHTEWSNGMVPRRQADRLYPITWAKHFTEVTK